MAWFHIDKPVPITWAGRPPQMLPEDVPVWQEWRSQNIGIWEEAYFNVALTTRTIDTSNMTQKMAFQAYFSIAKKIDAVVRKPGLIWIIEVTRRAEVRAVGQAITYRYLWDKIKPIPGTFESCILCEWADEDIQAVCKDQEIRLIQLHPLK